MVVLKLDSGRAELTTTLNRLLNKYVYILSLAAVIRFRIHKSKKVKNNNKVHHKKGTLNFQINSRVVTAP